MRLTADQELRKELLLFAMNKQSDVEAAIQMAARMEGFVLDGCQERAGKSLEAVATSVAPSPHVVPAGDAVPAPAGGSSDKPGNTEAASSVGIKGRKRRWSEADDRQFKELWRSARPLEEIAAELDRTTPSLYCRARALGLPRRSSVPQEEVPPAAPTAAQTEERNAAVEPTQARGDREPAPAASAFNGLKATEERLRRQVIPQGRCGAKGSDKAAHVGGARRGFGPQRGDPTSDTTGSGAAQDEVSEFFVDPIIQFLRSRDYSVVRVGSGQFRLDGRRVLNADELRQKANQIRKSLGQPPFTAELHQPVG